VGKTVDVLVPDLGEFHDVAIIEIVVKVGETVTKDQSLITLETDKATLDVPSPHAGTVTAIHVAMGDKVSKGSRILAMETAEAPAAKPAPVPAKPAPVPAKPAPAASQPAPPAKVEEPVVEIPPEVATATRKPASHATPEPSVLEPSAPPPALVVAKSTSHATPTIRKLARELGVDLAKVTGTGRKGRVLEKDLKAYVKENVGKPRASADGFLLPELPQIDFSRFGLVEQSPLSRIKRITGTNLHRAWLHVVHVTQHDEADITDLESFRKSQSEQAKKRNVKLTALPFVMKAVVAALKTFPTFNSSLDPKGENLILKRYYHFGVAVDTDQGLVVPVIRDVDHKGIYDLASELALVGEKARNHKLMPGDLQGGSFTLSSLGGIGGTAFTPIVNLPEVAILGLSRATMKPVWDGKTFVPRLMLPLSLSYDHRVIDGAEAVRFTTYLRELLSDIKQLLL
jgi:pyruvate dehydrogenase E2 component (dihydrolipoamide acetyltransferase)